MIWGPFSYSYVFAFTLVSQNLRLFQAGLFSAALTAFVVPKIQDLKVNPADQSVYYQNQTVHILDRILQQLASTEDQISTNSNPPLPNPTFHPLTSDRRANAFWLLSFICSLFAAFLATLVQQWSKDYMHIFQQADNPLQIARSRLFLFEGSERLPALAEVVHGLVHISLILFFWGLGEIILQIDTTIFFIILGPTTICVCLYLYCTIAPVFNPRSPYRTPFSWFVIQIFSRVRRYKEVMSTSIAKLQEAKSRMNRDVRAIQWLVSRTNGSDEMQALVLAIPGSFNGEWGREVWREVARDQSTSIVNSQARSHPGFSSAHEGTTVYELCRRMQYFFETYKDDGDYTSAGIGSTRRMHGYVETAASLVCCTGVELGFFGEVKKMLSDVGDKERTNDPLTTISNPSFTVRWTCLSLVAIWKIVNANMLQDLAKFALDGFARVHTDHGIPDMMTLMAIAQRIDGYLMKAWACVVELHLAFDSEPWSLSRTESEIITILNSRGESISELERIAIDAVGVEDVDWRISFFQERMDAITHELMQRLPGVFFNKLKPAAPLMISEAYDFPSVVTTPVPPPLIFPGQQIQSLCTLGRRLRDIIEGQNTEGHGETLKSLESLREIPVSLRGPKHLMKRQLWRLLDLRDGRGLGFTTELFFLAVRQLSSTSSSSELGLTEVYTGTFEVITSHWERSKNSAGTQRILFDILCDLVIRSRGVFSDFSYPRYIVEMLLDLVRKMVKGHGGLDPHINEVIDELEDDNLRNRMDNILRDQVLGAILPP
jgi:hypothetical protein